MNRLPEKMFLLNLRQDRFSNETIIFLVHTPPLLHLKNCGIFTQIRQKRPSQTLTVARFRDTYAPTCRKFVFTEPQARSFH